VGAALLVDAYHHLNVVPFDIRASGLASTFVTGGGYKYCQLGEGNCFLRVPPGCRMRPVLTGWFAEFEALPRMAADSRVMYAQGGAAFAGATYDPTSHYRAAAVFEFFAQQHLTPEQLRDINRRQIAILKAGVDQLDLPAIQLEPMSDERRGGFLALRADHASDIVRALRRRGVHADARGRILRLGPAPYVSDQQLRDAVGALREAVKEATPH
jgi:kynureninase